MESIQRQTFTNYEIHLITGVAPQGRAINRGASEARGDILVILDDDSTLADETVLETLVRVIDQDRTIGMAGASIVIPADANTFQRRAARQFPRFNTPVVDCVTDSDFACHGCCAIPKAVFWKVGGEREDIIRGLDPDLRVRLRRAGYRVVLAPRARIHHPLPDTWGKLMRQFYRNGFGSAYAQKFQPDSVYDTHETLSSDRFRPRRSLRYRILRFPLRLARALLEFKLLRFSAYIAYGFGYLSGMLTAREGRYL